MTELQEGPDDFGPEELILNDIRLIVCRFAPGSTASDNVANIFRRLVQSLDPNDSVMSEPSGQEVAVKYITQEMGKQSEVRDKLFSMKLLEICDANAGTEHAHAMAGQYLHLAKMIAAADGPISEQQQAALEHFELLLSIPGPPPNSASS